MKNFKLFLSLALIAMVTTAFSVWEYAEYPTEMTANSKEFAIELDNHTENVGGMSLRVVDGEMPTVTIDNYAATVSGNDITFVVSAQDTLTYDKYDFYYLVYSESSFASEVFEGVWYNGNNQNIEDYLNMVEVTGDGSYTIKVDDLNQVIRLTDSLAKENYMESDAGSELDADLASLEASLDGLKAEGGIKIQIRATLKEGQ